jgi:two-component system sensor histidine kinase UhpB
VAALDVAAEWRLFCGIVLVVLVSAVTGLIMVYLLIGAALRPLQTLSAEFVHIGAGDYRGRLTARGPSELLSLQTGFNAMVAQLANMTDRNRLLTEQLLTLQDEERADVARDLHDEIGPHLFAVNMDAEMIAQLSAAAGNAAVLHQARAIQGAVSHMQRQVRDLLGRLRPTPVTELGLRAAVDDLVRFWAERRPDIRFQVDLAEDGLRLSEGLKEVAYRVIQEGVNNAVRHGAPRSVEIKVTSNPEELHVLVQDDGVGSGTAPKAGGLGLVGMRERVAANGGRLVFGPRSEKGWSVMARLPSLGSAPETAQKPTPEAAPDQKVA